jgi:hypothetical protein
VPFFDGYILDEDECNIYLELETLVAESTYEIENAKSENDTGRC